MDNPRYDLSFTMYDSSEAGVLTQKFDEVEHEHIIAYVGQKINPAQKKYQMSEVKCYNRQISYDMAAKI